jgi:hypothetical protein
VSRVSIANTKEVCACASSNMKFILDVLETEQLLQKLKWYTRARSHTHAISLSHTQLYNIVSLLYPYCKAEDKKMTICLCSKCVIVNIISFDRHTKEGLPQLGLNILRVSNSYDNTGLLM